jgi:hypothetical protein
MKTTIPFESIVEGTEAEGAEILDVHWDEDGNLSILYDE